MKTSQFSRTAGLALVGLAWSSPAALANETAWEHTLAVYMVGASLDGSTGVGELSDVDYGDGNGVNCLVWDVATSGPEAAFAWRF